MSERFLFGKQEQPQTPENFKITELETASQIAEYFALADPILGVDWGEEGVPEMYTPEYIAAHPEETRVFGIKNNAGELVAGAKVTLLSDFDKERLGFVDNDYATKKGALLEYTAVKEDDRRKRLLAQLTKARLEWAKEKNVEYMCTECELENPISAHAKTVDGFKFIDVREPGMGVVNPYMVAVKSLTDNLPIVSGEKKKILITKDSKDELRKLFDEGWVGIDAQIPYQSESWTMIMQKKEI